MKIICLIFGHRFTAGRTALLAQPRDLSAMPLARRDSATSATSLSLMPVLYIRVEQPLKDVLEERAAENGRSLNREVSIRLRKSILLDSPDPHRFTRASTRGLELEFLSFPTEQI